MAGAHRHMFAKIPEKFRYKGIAPRLSVALRVHCQTATSLAAHIIIKSTEIYRPTSGLLAHYCAQQNENLIAIVAVLALLVGDF